MGTGNMMAIVLCVALLCGIAGAGVMCNYAAPIKVNYSSVTTLFPEAGQGMHLWIDAEIGSPFVGEAEIWIENDYGARYMLTEREEHLAPGNVRLEYVFTLPKSMKEGVYMLNYGLGGVRHTVPLSVSGSDSHGVVVWEDGGKLLIELDANVTGDVAVRTKHADGREENRMYRKQPANGTVLITEEICRDCWIEVRVGYDGAVVEVRREYGMYEKPYAHIVSLSRDEVVIEACAPHGHALYVNGELKGGGAGGRRVAVPLNGGYEDVQVRLAGDGGLLLEKGIALGMIDGSKGREITLTVPSVSPLTVRITARDVFGRDMHVSDTLSIITPDGGRHVELLEFFGSIEKSYNIEEGEYTIEFAGKSVPSRAVPVTYDAGDKEEVREEFIPRDAVPFIALVTVVAVVVMVLVWRKRVSGRV